MGSLEVGPSAVRIWSWSSRMGRGVRGEGKGRERRHAQRSAGWSETIWAG